MGTAKRKLFEEFPPVSVEQWEEAIKQDLKGADYEKKLIWKTDEGFSVKPYYTAEDIKNLSNVNYRVGEFPFVRGTKIGHNSWEIQQDIVVYDIKEANQHALEALERGATAICFVTNRKIDSKDKLIQLLNGIYIQCIDLSFIACSDAPDIFEWLTQLFNEKGINGPNARGSFNYNPIGVLTTTGNWITDENADIEAARSYIEKARQLLPNYRVLLANGSIIREAGSSIVQEVAFTLSMANEYLARLIDKGLTVDEVAPRIQFNVSIGSNYFFEIAKIRALRMLWAKIVEAYKPASLNSAKAYVHATTAFYNLTLYDPYVNMLRVTTESMSAVIGGVDSLSVRPFNIPYQKPNQFSYRIARNTQIILKEEAYFDKVSDPSAGSYYVESLTASIANEAWKLFLQVENEGGYIQALKRGWIQEKIENSAQKIYSDVAARKQTVLGTNQYPNFNETMNDQIDFEVYTQQPVLSDKPIVKPLKRIRISSEIEQLRLKTEQSGKRPKVFMLTIGNLAMRLARAQFSCNFFAVAGFEVIDNNGFATIDEGVKAALKANADIVVLCSSDEEYATYAPEAFRALDNKAIFVVAGAPACMDELKAQGIINFISIRSNVLETLSYYQQLLQIQ